MTVSRPAMFYYTRCEGVCVEHASVAELHSYLMSLPAGIDVRCGVWRLVGESDYWPDPSEWNSVEYWLVHAF